MALPVRACSMMSRYSARKRLSAAMKGMLISLDGLARSAFVRHRVAGETGTVLRISPRRGPAGIGSAKGGGHAVDEKGVCGHGQHVSAFLGRFVCVCELDYAAMMIFNQTK
jgi:hypothetical protein